jgi:hypothetical protein
MISREDISEIFGESHNGTIVKIVKFENLGESQLKMESLELI